MRHPWVEGDVIMHDALPSWQLQLSNLGFLVKEIREEFTQRPPAKKNGGANEITRPTSTGGEEG
jgi:ESCRT-I complex subunit VPS37